MTEIRLLTLEWRVGGDGADDLAERFLAAAERIDPRALPRRFGRGEPELGATAVGRAGRDAFVAGWRQHPFLQGWTGRAPYLEGHVSWSPDRPEPAGMRRQVVVHVTVNGSVIAANQDECDRMVHLFTAVAEALPAFFAAGYVERHHGLDQHGKAYFITGSESHSADWVTGPWWAGLPPKPTWLEWFGAPYAALVADSLAGQAVEQGTGLLVRHGQLPMDVDEVRPVARRLPDEVIEAFEPVLAEHLSPGVAGPIVVDWGRSPAPYVPDLTRS